MRAEHAVLSAEDLFAQVWDETVDPFTNTRQTINTIATREPGTSDKADARLVHADCRKSSGLPLHDAYEPSGLA